MKNGRYWNIHIIVVEITQLMQLFPWNCRPTTECWIDKIINDKVANTHRHNVSWGCRWGGAYEIFSSSSVILLKQRLTETHKAKILLKKNCRYLRSQVGVLLDHVPLDRQVSSFSPCRENPELQENCAVLPSGLCVKEYITWPFWGAEMLEHCFPKKRKKRTYLIHYVYRIKVTVALEIQVPPGVNWPYGH